ncbi:hypothetical protein NDU88_006391 [Pleurodeles waltl]|uniref:Uncharacterized protein n=1 Tax=Pleurodeles waltl TaxID=8319 RepID=A0AAV7LNZ9_PLEWA|nr:hypothetical protein NDU88_006391 [Pleurodeles waltl]
MEGPIRDPGRPRLAASGSHLPCAERREAPQAQSSAAAPSHHNSWGRPGIGPKDGCSVLVGALLCIGAHAPTPLSRPRVESAAVSAEPRLRGPGLGARDREGPIHSGNEAVEGPVQDHRRPSPATNGSRLPCAERREAPQARSPAVVTPRGRGTCDAPGSARAPLVTGAPPSLLGVPVGRWCGGEMPQGTGYLLHLVGRERSL